MKPAETKQTAQIMKEMAVTMRRHADDIEKIAKRMEQSGDLSYTGEALNCVSNCISALRLDLLATRPIRAYEQMIAGCR